MAKLEVGKGLDIYLKKLEKLERAEKDEFIGKAVYEGAGVVADAVKASIQSLPTVEGWGTQSHPLPGGIFKWQKAGLVKGFGISKARNDGGFINVKLGFDGYNGGKETEQWPAGPPNALIARACESGTSWKRKYPFVRPAVNRVRAEAERKMKQVIDDACERIMK